MGEIMVVAEHREQEMREITLEMLNKADALCEALSHKLTLVVLGGKEMPFVAELAKRADEVLVFSDDRLQHFDSETYKAVLLQVIEERRPFLTLLGHTPWGMDLAPGLAVKTGYPLATDSVDILMEEDRPMVIRQVYSGKIFSKVSFMDAPGYLVTMRPAAFPPDMRTERQGGVVQMAVPAELPESGKSFMEFVDAAAGEVDIAQAQLLLSIGRGVGDAENIPEVMELAERMGGVVSCSRPVVDKNWLPKFRQVGTSGKSVKPKVYFALGISGAFQHVAGISGAGTVIAVNKDKKAPIFRVADYGVTADLFEVVTALKGKLD